MISFYKSKLFTYISMTSSLDKLVIACLLCLWWPESNLWLSSLRSSSPHTLRGWNHERNNHGLNTLVWCWHHRATILSQHLIFAHHFFLPSFQFAVLISECYRSSAHSKRKTKKWKHLKRKFQVYIFNCCVLMSLFVLYEDWMYRDNHGFDRWELCINTWVLW